MRNGLEMGVRGTKVSSPGLVMRGADAQLSLCSKRMILDPKRRQEHGLLQAREGYCSCWDCAWLAGDPPFRRHGTRNWELGWLTPRPTLHAPIDPREQEGNC